MANLYNTYNPNHFALCYYPTTIMLVSNNPRYTMSLRALGESSFIYQRYQQAQEAVYSIIQALHNALPTTLSCFHKQQNAEADCIYNKAVNNISKRRTDKYRFAEPSVVLFDADSVTDWQSACEQLQGSSIQRVLHGGTNEDIIQAYNAGLIDYAMASEEGASTLQRLQKKYFQTRTQYLLPGLQQHSLWLEDFAFTNYWQSLQREYQITEYYYINEPSGFIGITANGSTYRLIVYDDSEMDGQIDCAKDLNAPEALIDKLKSKKYIPYFSTKDSYYNNNINNLFACLHKAKQIKSKKNYYCAMVMEKGVGE